MPWQLFGFEGVVVSIPVPGDACEDCGSTDADHWLGEVLLCDRCFDKRVARLTCYPELPEAPPSITLTDAECLPAFWRLNDAEVRTTMTTSASYKTWIVLFRRIKFSTRVVVLLGVLAGFSAHASTRTVIWIVSGLLAAWLYASGTVGKERYQSFLDRIKREWERLHSE